MQTTNNTRELEYKILSAVCDTVLYGMRQSVCSLSMAKALAKILIDIVMIEIHTARVNDKTLH
jgi:hypothetical protein